MKLQVLLHFGDLEKIYFNSRPFIHRVYDRIKGALH